MLLGCLAWLWVLRRFGLLVMVIFSLFPIRWIPSVLGRLAGHAVDRVCLDTRRGRGDRAFG